MNKLEFNDKLDDFIKSLKNYKQTDNKRALELYVGYLKETDGTTPMTKYLAENGKNPHGPLFGYGAARNAMGTGRYLYEKLRNVIEDKYIFQYMDDWREEPSLFPAEEPAEPAQSSIEELGHTVHIARTLDTISLMLNELMQLLDTKLNRLVMLSRHIEAKE